jgi:hypothetical protein
MRIANARRIIEPFVASSGCGISISLRVTVSKGPMQRRQSNHRSKESPDRPGVRRRPIETVALLLEVTWEHHPTRIKDEPYTPGNPPKLGM